MIKWLFGVAPKVGSIWRLNNRDPFKQAFLVKVLDVKRGWVKYVPVEAGFVYEDLSATVRVFRDLYREE